MRRSLLLFLALAGISLHAQAQTLTPSATASLLTCGPGADFYTSFGHSALRITDTALGLDLVYNYGCFDFNTPHFYWRFTRGSLDYCLCRTTMADFLADYQSEGRYVYQQHLNLTPHEVSNLFLLLETNYLPDYRYYRYDILRDNCATRLRDAITAACGANPPRFADTLAPALSYRQLLHRSTADSLLWWQLGYDLLLGINADHRCTPSEAMFHPLAMQAIVAQSRRASAPLAAPSQLLTPATRTPLHRSFPPLVATTLLFLAVALLTWRCPRLLWLDRTLFTLAGIAGLFLLFMWFGTSHYCTGWNLNILWLSPLLLLVAIRLGHSPRWALWLQEAAFAAAAVWVLACGLSIAIFPLILTLALRTAIQFKRP
ncbi:MAG: DUF4105 domain-containing protein [Bacteroidales bacterium]|nr:DUF4105 domain-containing protein [Bacteroidales bacterium]